MDAPAKAPTPPADMTQEEWLQKGLDAGWITTFCGMHAMTPMTPDETEKFNDDMEPCLPALRYWEDP